MKGVTKLQLNLLLDAAAPTTHHRTDMDDPMARESIEELLKRGLVYLHVIHECAHHAVAEGRITSLGREALRIALIEPTLVRG